MREKHFFVIGMRKGTLIVGAGGEKAMKKGVSTSSMSSGPSVLRATSIPLNEHAIKTALTGKEYENKMTHTAMMTRVLTSRAEHAYEYESGKCTVILQVVTGGPVHVNVTGKDARFSDPFSLEAGKLEETSKGGVYIWSFVGSHLVIEDAVKITVTLANNVSPVPATVYTITQVTL